MEILLIIIFAGKHRDMRNSFLLHTRNIFYRQPKLSLGADEVQSQTIYLLRFILIAAVVFGHAYLNSPWEPYQGKYSLFVYIFIRIFQRMPILVFFSGFLFFRSGFSTQAYGKKLKSRVKSLLIPYLFWNAAVVVFYMVCQLWLLHQGQTLHEKPILSYDWQDWLQAFGFSESLPIAKQFWFIRNLMVLMILSPIFYLLIRYLKFFGLVACALPWFLVKYTGVTVVFGMSVYSCFFFALGAWFAMRKENFVLRFMPHWIWTGLIFLILAGWNAYDYVAGKAFDDILGKITVCLNTVSVIGCAGSLVASGKLRVNVALCQSSFFIFALHMIPLGYLKNFLLPLIPSTGWGYLFIHLFSTTAIILLCIGIYKLMHRFTPRFLAFITGGR